MAATRPCKRAIGSSVLADPGPNGLNGFSTHFYVVSFCKAPRLCTWRVVADMVTARCMQHHIVWCVLSWCVEYKAVGMRRKPSLVRLCASWWSMCLPGPNGVGWSKMSCGSRERVCRIWSWRLRVACTIFASVVVTRSLHAIC